MINLAGIERPRKNIQNRERWEAHELATLFPVRYGTTKQLAERLGRSRTAIIAKRHEFHRARKSRLSCGAFLPDDGIPFRVKALAWHGQR